MSLTSFFDRTLSYERDSGGPDAAGGKAPVTVQTLATGIPACIAPADDRTTTIYHRRGTVVDYTILTATDLSGVPGGPLIDDRFNDNGTLYIVCGVQRVSNPIIYPGPIYRYHCRLITPTT